MTLPIDGTFLAILAPFLTAVIAPLAVKLFRHHAVWLLAIIPFAIFYHYSNFVGQFKYNTGIANHLEWLWGLGWPLSYLLDGLSLMFVLLISGIGGFIVIYSGGYLKNHPQLGRFLAFIFLFMGAMQGLVISDNLITMFIFWELTSVASFLLIGFNHNREASRRSAIQALVITGGGGLALLAGIILVEFVTGTTDLSLLLTQPGVLQNNSLYLPILLLFLGGAFTKSAQFPLHFWLPNAMEAPTPVSAYLHSATMVKAGVYLLMRIQPIMGDTLLWSLILPIFGGLTLLVGTLLAVRQSDLKLMLAYTTVASLGLLVMLTGTSNKIAIEGAVIYLFAHSLFKGALFMVAGTIDHGTGTRDVTKLGGLLKVMPVTFFAAVMATFSMAGLPPFIGFIAKEEIYAGIWGTEIQFLILTVVSVIGNALMLVIGFAIAFKPFWGVKTQTPKTAHEGSVQLLLGPVSLAILGLVFAIYLNWTEDNLITPLAASVIGVPVDLNLYILPTELKPNVLLSIITVLLGLIMFTQLSKLRSFMAHILGFIGWGPDKGFDQVMRHLVISAHYLTQIVQPGRMEIYLRVTFLATALVLSVSIIIFHELPLVPEFPTLKFYEWSVMGLAIIGLLAVLFAKNRLTAIVALGIQGFSVALLFVLFGAPDLSFTQFMIETLSVVILALVMARLSLYQRDHRPLRPKIIDGGLALATGTGFFLVLLATVQQPFNTALTDFFREYSVPIAHGRNIVNVILVDFRGLDTLGEISVVAIAGLAILALVRIRNREEGTAA